MFFICGCACDGIVQHVLCLYLCVSCMLWYVLYTRSVYSAAMVCMIPTTFCIIVFVAVPLCVSCMLWYVLYTRSVYSAAMVCMIRSMFV